MFRFLGGLHPALYMMIAVVANSAFPILFKLGGAEESPFLFTGIYQGSIGIGVGAAIMFFKKDLILKPMVRKDIMSHCKGALMLFAVIGRCGVVLFTLALVFVDVSIAAILYETWPLILMLLMSRLFKDTKRYRPITWGTLILVVPAISGAALVILSQNDTPRLLGVIGTDFVNLGTSLGVFLVLMAAVGAAAHGAGTLRLGESLAKTHTHTDNRRTGEIVFAMVMTCISQVLSGGLLCVSGLIVSESISWHQLIYAVAGGFFITSVGALAFRWANLNTDNLGVNALAFATPLVALLWLWMFSIFDASHLDYLIVGAMGIVASNLLINVDASNRFAYKALVASLWVFGTITYFTEGYVTDVPLELPVTIYILVLSFRVERLARRTTEEEGFVFDVFRKLRSMAASQDSPHSAASKALVMASRSLLNIDHHKSAESLKNAYETTLEHLEEARKAGITPGEITEICRMVDKLAHSRQQGSRFGEIVAIALTGLLIVLGLMVFSGDREIYGEIASFVLSSVVVFLFFNIIDLQGDRKDETMVTGKKGRYIVNFGGVKDREAHQYVSMATSAGIVAVFVWLFFTNV